MSYFDPNLVQEWQVKICRQWFPDHEADQDTAFLYGMCLNQFDTFQKQAESYCSEFEKHSVEYENCSRLFRFNTLSTQASLKLLSAGVYLSKQIRNPVSNKRMKQLDDLLAVHKKGERYFAQTQIVLDRLKSTLSSEEFEAATSELSLYSRPYVFTRNFLCRSPIDPERNRYFIAPQVFTQTSLLIYDFSLKKFVSLQAVCERFSEEYEFSKMKKQQFHEILFQRPVIYRKTSYENLYLAMEDILNQNYSSSKELTQDYKSRSQDQLDAVERLLKEDMEALINNYYKNMINTDSEVHADSSLKDFSSFYHPQKILFDVDSFSGGLKGLEISIFQVNYWLNNLKYLLQLGDNTFVTKIDEREESRRISINRKELYIREGFDQDAFERMRREVLSLLQSYHDSYLQKTGPYLTIADERLLADLNFLFNSEGRHGLKSEYQTGSRLLILQEKYFSGHFFSGSPVLIPSDIVLSHILEFSIPNWNNPGTITNLQSNPPLVKKDWEPIVHSVLFELNRSLNHFFSYLQSLQLKDTFEKQLSETVTQ